MVRYCLDFPNTLEYYIGMKSPWTVYNSVQTVLYNFRGFVLVSSIQFAQNMTANYRSGLLKQILPGKRSITTKALRSTEMCEYLQPTAIQLLGEKNGAW